MHVPEFIYDSRLDRMMQYPVGNNIMQNISTINAMSENILKELKKDKVLDVNLICRGSSGAIISALISAELYKNDIDCSIVHVKKEGESSHNSSLFLKRNSHNIIVDDFISSGATMKEIYKAICNFHNNFIQIDMLVVTASVGSAELNFVPVKIISGQYHSDSINYKELKLETD